LRPVPSDDRTIANLTKLSNSSRGARTRACRVETFSTQGLNLICVALTLATCFGQTQTATEFRFPGAATGVIGSAGSAFFGTQPADVEVTDEAAARRFSGRADFEGVFRFPDLPPGQYSIRLTAPNFRDVTLHAVPVKAGELTDVGVLRMLAECEVPGTGLVCIDSPHLLISLGGAGQLDMVGCARATGIQWPCLANVSALRPGPALDASDADFWLRTANDGAWLVPLKNAYFSLNPSTVTYEAGCPNATYKPGPIRIDHLPPHSRACVRTHGGGYAELRFTGNIVPGQKDAAIDFIFWSH
jgi:hypothetical protein